MTFQSFWSNETKSQYTKFNRHTDNALDYTTVYNRLRWYFAHSNDQKQHDANKINLRTLPDTYTAH